MHHVSPRGLGLAVEAAQSNLATAPVDSEVEESLKTWLDAVGDNVGRLSLDERDLVGQIIADLSVGLDALRDYGNVRKVTSWGTARKIHDKPWLYEFAAGVSAQFVQMGWGGIDGGGPGVMEAAREPFLRAADKLSFPVSLDLAFEPRDAELAALPTYSECKYFSPRKFLMVRAASALVVYPGGFGTLDEFFEALTLVQTGKGKPMPIVLADPGGRGFWQHITAHIDMQIREGFASKYDNSHISIATTEDEVVQQVADAYRNYQRRVVLPGLKDNEGMASKDPIIIETLAPVTMQHLAELNDRFANILVPRTRFTRLTPTAADSASNGLDRLGLYLQARNSNALPEVIRAINQLPGVEKAHKALGVHTPTDLLTLIADNGWTSGPEATKFYGGRNSPRWAAPTPAGPTGMAPTLPVVARNGEAAFDFGVTLPSIAR